MLSIERVILPVRLSPACLAQNELAQAGIRKTLASEQTIAIAPLKTGLMIKRNPAFLCPCPDKGGHDKGLPV